jgi:uncharacterized protein (DUF362 family)
MLTRRRFLKAAAASGAIGGAAPLALDLSGCAPVPLDRAALGADDVLFGLYRRDAFAACDAVDAALGAVDFSWLSAGDSVLVKVACNSGNVHPATTALSSVRGMVRALFARGAGRVVVGDQSGVHEVRLAAGERRFSSTRALMERNGLLAAIEESGAEAHFFDDQGFDDGYFAATPPDDTSWKEPMMIANIVRDVDHIVYLPRLACHGLAGYTHGLKLAIGFLRDDARLHLHHDAAMFYEKYVDVNLCDEIASRLRLTFTFVEKMMLHYGPDLGTVVDVDPFVCVASNNVAVHDLLSVPILDFVNQRTPIGSEPGYPGGLMSDVYNFAFVTFLTENNTGIPWGSPIGYTPYVPHTWTASSSSDRALIRAFFAQGGIPETVRVVRSGSAPDDELRAHIERYGGGRFTFD